MTLPAVLEPHGEHQRQLRRPARRREHAHLTTGGIETQIQRIAPHRRRARVGGVGEHLLPLREPRMDDGHGFEPWFAARGLDQPLVPFGRVAPEQTRQVRDPRLVDLDTIERLDQGLRRRARDLAPRIGAEEGVDVDAHQSAGKAPGGKMRTAFFQRTRASSSLLSSDSR